MNLELIVKLDLRLQLHALLDTIAHMGRLIKFNAQLGTIAGKLELTFIQNARSELIVKQDQPRRLSAQ